MRPASDKLYVMWTPPVNQNVRVRHYILGWGKGVPDMFNQELEEKNRTYIIERLGELGQQIYIQCWNDFGNSNSPVEVCWIPLF